MPSKPIHSPVDMKAFCADQEAFDEYKAYFEANLHTGSPERYPCVVSSDWDAVRAMNHSFMYTDDYDLSRYDGDNPIYQAIRDYKAK